MSASSRALPRASLCIGATLFLKWKDTASPIHRRRETGEIGLTNSTGTVYPDGVAVRRSVLWSNAAERDKAEFQESIVLVPPGETPEDSLHFDALTFANLDGAASTYRWQPKTTPRTCSAARAGELPRAQGCGHSMGQLEIATGSRSR